MIKSWKPLYAMYFELGIKTFSFHVADSYERRRLTSSIRTYLLNHGMDGDYKVESVDKVVNVTHKDLIFN